MRLGTIRSLTRASVAILAAVGTTTVLAATPASAAVPSSRCPETFVCFWTGENFTGTMTVHANPVNHDCWATDRAHRTVFNNDDQTWSFYADQSCRDHVETLDPGGYYTGRRIHSWQ